MNMLPGIEGKRPSLEELLDADMIPASRDCTSDDVVILIATSHHEEEEEAPRLLRFGLHLFDPCLHGGRYSGSIKDISDAVLRADSLAPLAIIGQGIESLEHALGHEISFAEGLISDHEWCRQCL